MITLEPDPAVPPLFVLERRTGQLICLRCYTRFDFDKYLDDRHHIDHCDEFGESCPENSNRRPEYNERSSSRSDGFLMPSSFVEPWSDYLERMGRLYESVLQGNPTFKAWLETRPVRIVVTPSTPNPTASKSSDPEADD